jgi:hypothetical protein
VEVLYVRVHGVWLLITEHSVVLRALLRVDVGRHVSVLQPWSGWIGATNIPQSGRHGYSWNGGMRKPSFNVNENIKKQSTSTTGFWCLFFSKVVRATVRHIEK